MYILYSQAGESLFTTENGVNLDGLPELTQRDELLEMHLRGMDSERMRYGDANTRPQNLLHGLSAWPSCGLK